MGILDLFSPNQKPEEGSYKSPKNELYVFIVDDNEIFAKLIEQNLKLREKQDNYKIVFRTLSFTTGEACLENLHTKPDVVILDYFLSASMDGNMNGDKVFKRIMQINPEQKVIMLSAQEESKIVHNLVKLGLRNYIIKDDDMFEQLHLLLEEIYKSK